MNVEKMLLIHGASFYLKWRIFKNIMRSIFFYKPCAVLVLVSPLFLSACAIPGTYLGVQGPAKTSVTLGDDVSDRADIYTISAESVGKLEARQQLDIAEMQAKRPSAPIDVEPYVYRVGPQDILRVTIWNHPELNNPGVTANMLSGQTVGADGTFFYPYVGEVKAAGKTLKEIREDMTTRLVEFLKDPQLDVSVVEFLSQRVYAVGQLVEPGVRPVSGVPLRITDLVTRSKGFTPQADLSAATVTRQGQQLPVDLYGLYYQGDTSQNMLLKDGDVLNVPEARLRKVFVLGEVAKPTVVPMPRGRITLADALGEAGGFNPLTANAGQVYVIRTGDAGRPEIWHLNASSPEALVLADRFSLKARDVVYVDPANIARFGRVISNIVPSAAVFRAAVQN